MSGFLFIADMLENKERWKKHFFGTDLIGSFSELLFLVHFDAFFATDSLFVVAVVHGVVVVDVVVVVADDSVLLDARHVFGLRAKNELSTTR